MGYGLAKGFGILEGFIYMFIFIFSASIFLATLIDGDSNNLALIASIINCILVGWICFNGFKTYNITVDLELAESSLDIFNRTTINNEYNRDERERKEKLVKDLKSKYKSRSRNLWLLPLIHIIYIAIVMYISSKMNQ